MLIVQIFFVLFALFSLSRVFVMVRKRQLSFALGSLAIVVWASVIVFSLQPEWLNHIARIVGIGRGVDTAIYISIVVLFYLVFRILVRLEKMEDQVTTVVRKNALNKYFDKKKHE